MAKVLRGGAYGPDGVEDYVPAGEPPNPDWPAWFIADLEEHDQLVDGPKRRAVADGTPVVLEGTAKRARRTNR